MDAEGLNLWKSQIQAFSENKLNSPEGVFQDTIQKVMSNYAKRRRSIDANLFPELNLQKSIEIYKQRFANAGDFTFVFVGNLKGAEMKDMIQKYIANLPGTPNKEMYKDLNLQGPKGITNRTIKKGSEPKARVLDRYYGDFEWNYKNRIELDATIQVLSIMLRESMREEKGGVYGVGAYAQLNKLPKPRYNVSIGYGCSPENKDMLISTSKEQINLLKKEGASAKNLSKVKEIYKRQRESDMKENRFWLTKISAKERGMEDLNESINNYQKYVDAVNEATTKEVANKYFGGNVNMAEFVLMPEK
jgi:zinc protease